MTNVTKILLSLFVAAIVSPTKTSVAQAVTIINGSDEFESMDSATSGIGLGSYTVLIGGLDNGPESLSISGNPANCDFDQKGCGTTTAAILGNTAGIPTANDTAISTGSTSGGATKISEPTVLLLLILGLIGLSRLRGRPMD